MKRIQLNQRSPISPSAKLLLHQCDCRNDLATQFGQIITSSIPYSVNRQFMECDWRNGSEEKPMIAQTQYSITSARSRSLAIVIFSIDSYRNPRGPTSMIQPTLNSSDYHFQICHWILRAQFKQPLSEIPLRFRHCFLSSALSPAIEL